MGTLFWRGTTNAWGTAGNWSTGAAPVTGDIAIFDTGSQSVAGSDQSAVALNRLIVYSAYTGDIGTEGSPLLIDVNNSTNPFILFQGTGSLWLRGTVTKAVCDSTSTATYALVLGDGSTAKTAAEVVCVNGNTRIRGGTTATTLTVIYPTQAGNVVCTLDASSVVTTCNQTGGVVSSAIMPTTLNVDGGTFTQAAGTGTITTLNLRNTGTYAWNYPGGTITTLNVYGAATFNAAGLKAASTITNCNRYSAKSKMLLNNGRRITFTNNIINTAGSLDGITVDTGSTLAIS